MERLYRAKLRMEPADVKVPERLPGLRSLAKVERVRIDLDRAQTCLAAVASSLGVPAASLADLAPIVDALAAFESQQPADVNAASGSAGTTTGAGDDPLTAFRRTALAAHRSLLVSFNAAGAPYGKAYGLGRALADTCRPAQSDEDLSDGFAPHRLEQLKQWLDDLASALPPHAAKAVIQSITWWRDTVYLRDGTDEGQRRRALVGSVRSDAPGLRHTVRPNPKLAGGSSASLTELMQPLERQGELWRVVLTGEKDPLDLLSPEGYIAAGRRVVRAGRRMVAQAMFSAPLTSLAGFLLITLIGAAVIWVVAQSSATHGGRLAGYLVAVGGYLATLGRVVGPRLRSVSHSMERPLWDTALDYVCAEAVSLPPVGAQDAAGWSKLAASGPDAPAAVSAGTAPASAR
jgi:hypothetical protein